MLGLRARLRIGVSHRNLFGFVLPGCAALSPARWGRCRPRIRDQQTAGTIPQRLGLARGGSLRDGSVGVHDALTRCGYWSFCKAAKTEGQWNRHVRELNLMQGITPALT